MKVLGDIESINLRTGERKQRITGDGESVLRSYGERRFYAVGASKGPSWEFNGNLDEPTFMPSLKITGVQRMTDAEHATIRAGGKIEPRPLCCHLNITDGKIIYDGDCTHSMAGKTVLMEDVDA